MIIFCLDVETDPEKFFSYVFIELYMSHDNLLSSCINFIFALWTGFAVHVSQDIVSNLRIDLDFLANEKDLNSSVTNSKVQPELSNEFHHKKRKRTKSSLQEQPSHGGVEAEVSDNLTPISVKIAALEALEALLTVVCHSYDDH